MKYYCLEPEVAGGLGPRTRIDGAGPPLVTKLHYVFDGWLGDEILESGPCFIVTKRLAESIGEHKFTGVAFDDVEIGCSETFRELHSDSDLPPFGWMKVRGKRGQDDFFLAEDRRLVVSERAWEILRPGAANAVVSEYPGG